MAETHIIKISTWTYVQLKVWSSPFFEGYNFCFDGGYTDADPQWFLAHCAHSAHSAQMDGFICTGRRVKFRQESFRMMGISHEMLRIIVMAIRQAILCHQEITTYLLLHLWYVCISECKIVCNIPNTNVFNNVKLL